MRESAWREHRQCDRFPTYRLNCALSLSHRFCKCILLIADFWLFLPHLAQGSVSSILRNKEVVKPLEAPHFTLRPRQVGLALRQLHSRGLECFLQCLILALHHLLVVGEHFCQPKKVLDVAKHASSDMFQQHPSFGTGDGHVAHKFTENDVDHCETIDDSWVVMHLVHFGLNSTQIPSSYRTRWRPHRSRQH